jgi:hypothetical protein
MITGRCVLGVELDQYRPQYGRAGPNEVCGSATKSLPQCWSERVLDAAVEMDKTIAVRQTSASVPSAARRSGSLSFEEGARRLFLRTVLWPEAN